MRQPLSLRNILTSHIRTSKKWYADMSSVSRLSWGSSSTSREFRRSVILSVVHGDRRLMKSKSKAEKDDLQAVIVANPQEEGGFAFMQRLEFTLERGRLKQLVEALKEENLTLETIAK